MTQTKTNIEEYKEEMKKLPLIDLEYELDNLEEDIQEHKMRFTYSTSQSIKSDIAQEILDLNEKKRIINKIIKTKC